MNNITQKFITALFFVALIPFFTLAQQKDKHAKMAKETDELTVKIYDMLDRYPDVTYSYNYNSQGEVESVTVKGVSDAENAENLENWLTQLNRHRNVLVNVMDVNGIYYVTREEARPKKSYTDLHRFLSSEITYPESAESRGIEGNVYVKFVVDENGNVNRGMVVSDIKNAPPHVSEEMRKEAIEAVKDTSGKWIPAEVNNEDVPSWVILPVKFEVEPSPATRLHLIYGDNPNI